jgi:probable ATP-dependent RNA helicase DDX4
MPAKEDRTTMMFSTTFPDKVQDLGKEMLKDDYLFCTVGIVGGATETVTQEVIKCEKREQFEKMQGMLQVAKDNGDRILIFVETKRQTDFTASKLCQNDFPATSIHGDRQQMEREEALRTFKSGETPVLVATNVAARGLDIPGVTHVINMEMPKDIDEYVHRIGRTGRCGNKGKATSFFDEERDAEMAPHLVKILSNAKQVVPDFLQELVGDGPSATAGGGGNDDAEDDDDGW